mmetsp:Transcript_16660/g.40137  ORF Transcript_16660/g.40137 Transcript_16660/m.40137 type:complete len:220 (-) Transcript_16660:1360-2019(-)
MMPLESELSSAAVRSMRSTSADTALSAPLPSSSMTWMVIRSSSSMDTATLPSSSKWDEFPLSTSVIKAASMLSVSISALSTALICVLATSSMIRSRVSSASLLAVPTMMSALATSLRSVFAVTPSQKMLMPPATMGIEAVSVVFICVGSSPSFGVGPALPPTLLSVSSAFTTNETKTLFDKSELAMPSSTSNPRGILNETKESGVDSGLKHMLDLGPHG